MALNITTLRAGSSTLGIFLLIVALCLSMLYETEEGVIRNKLDVLWIRLSDARSTALSRQAQFARSVAALTDAFFERVFGRALVSWRSVAVSVCFSLVSLGIACMPGLYDYSVFPDVVAGLYFPVILLLLAAGILPALLRGKLPVKVWYLSVAILCVAVFAGMHSMDWFSIAFAHGHPIPELTWDALFLVLTIGFDSFFVAATRWLLREAATFHTGLRILAAVLGNVCLAAMLVVLPLIGPAWSEGKGSLAAGVHQPVAFFERQALFNPSRHVFFLTLAGSNLFDAAVALAFFGLFLIMLLHRVLWPLLQTPIYALGQRDLARLRKWCFGLGALFLGLGLPAGPLVRLGQLVKRIIDGVLG